VIRAFCAAARPLKRLAEAFRAKFFWAAKPAPHAALSALQWYKARYADRVREKTFALSNIAEVRISRVLLRCGEFFGRRLRWRKSFRKGVSVSIEPAARRRGVKRNLYTKLVEKDVFFASVV